MFVVYDIWGCFFSLLIEIISIAKLLTIVHFFVLKHEKQTLNYVNFLQNLKLIETPFFSPIYFVGVPVFLPQHWKLLGPERLISLKLLGMNKVKFKVGGALAFEHIKSHMPLLCVYCLQVNQEEISVAILKTKMILRLWQNRQTTRI